MLDRWVEELEQALDQDAPADRTAQNPRKQVPRALIERATPARLIRYALTDWLVVAALWLAMSRSPPELYPLWALLVAGRLHSLGVILHDAIHLPLRSGAWGLRGVELLAGFPLASTLAAMRYHHLRHHRDNGMATDPYFKPGVEERPLLWWLIWLRHLLLLPHWTVRGPFGLLAWLVPGLRTPYARVFLQDRSGRNLERDPEVLACARAELGQVLFQTSVVVLGILAPSEVLYGYVIPAVIAGLLAGRRVLMEHRYVPAPDRRLETILRTTRDHGLGFFGALLLAPRNVGCHVVHHLHPQAGLHRLPMLRSWYLEHVPEYRALAGEEAQR